MQADCFDLIPQRLGALRQLQPEGGTYAADMDFITRISGSRAPNQASPATSTYHITPVNGARYPAIRSRSALYARLHFPRGEDFGSDDGKNSYGGWRSTF